MSLDLLVTIFIGVVSIFLSAFFYIRSRRKPGYDPVYLRDSDSSIPLRELSPSDIVQLVNDGRIERLARAVLVLWNKGFSPLLASHVPPNHPVTISFPDRERILSYRTLRSHSKGSEIRLEPIDNKQLLLKFHHINHNDGIAIELIHASTHRYPDVNSCFVGLSRGFRDLGSINRPRPDFAPSDFVMRWVVTGFMFLLALHGVLSLLYPKLMASIYAGDNFETFRVAFYFLGATGMFWFPRFVRVMWKERRRCPRDLDVTRKIITE